MAIGAGLVAALSVAILMPVAVRAADSTVQIADGGGINLARVDALGGLQVVNEEATQPFQKTLPFSQGACCASDPIEVTMVTVPKTKRLIIDYYSGRSGTSTATTRGRSCPTSTPA
jgi:hypothetical protein